MLDGEFDQIVDAQTVLEQGDYVDYVTVMRRSLVDILGMEDVRGAEIAAGIGSWPFYVDAPLLHVLRTIAPCAAMTNSDRIHGEQLQARLGPLDDWLCSENIQIYKPDPAFWQHMSRRRGIEPGPHWWHVSAYADYDLKTANDLGLTTVFVERPHARQGSATHRVRNLQELVDVLS